MKSRLLMHARNRWISTGLCLGVMISVSASAELPPSTAGSSGLTGLLAGQDVERGYSREEEHESNGPAGSAGVPMQRLPLAGIALAAAVLVATWRLMPRQKA